MCMYIILDPNAQIKLARHRTRNAGRASDSSYKRWREYMGKYCVSGDAGKMLLYVAGLAQIKLDSYWLN